MKAVTVEAMRALDAQAIAAGISGYTLMERAGRGAFAELTRVLAWRLPAASPRAFTVLAGRGNNGGDAYVVARCLAEAQHPVAVFAVCAPGDLAGDALAHATRLPAAVSVQVAEELPAESLSPGHVVIDGLLGTGFRGALRPPYEGLVRQVNASGCPVVALDIPSGLDGDTGQAGSVAIAADWTMTMGLPKQGLLTPAGLRSCGALRCIDLGVPESLLAALPAAGPEAIMLQDARALVRRRPRDAHKGVFGHVLIVGGSGLYGGAPFLAAGGAARAGAGLVTVAIPAGCRPVCAVPAALIVRRVADDGEGCFGQASLGELAGLARGRSAIVFGPGLGDAKQGQDVLAQLIAGGLPLVVDADGLRLLAAAPSLTLRARAAMVLTPHPGEMAALLKGFGCPVAAPAGRVEQAQALAAASGALVVLKGMGTVVAAPDGRAAINTSGSVALATAGTGDVLAGVIGALLGQGLSGWDAARLGVFVHGLAAETVPGAARAMTADDLVLRLGAAWSEISPVA
jgi:ADP-dependent NAD(P)H-hydrate dehydratase / NAD(P)H-hydrate epimerase